MTTESSKPRPRRGAGGKGRSRRRVPLAKAVPPNALAALNLAIRALAERSPEAIGEIHERFELLEKHNVTLRQTINHAKRLPAKLGRDDRPVERAESDTAATPELEAYRRRMNAIGEALSVVFVGMGSADSDLWGRGVYLKLVGRLYDVLDSDDLELDDLQAVSKMICDQRRAQNQALDVRRRFHTDRRSDDGEADQDAAGSPSARELPPHFSDVVKQIYGVNLQRRSEG